VRNPYRYIGIAVVALLGLALSVSCGLKRNPPERRHFVLEAPRPDPQSPAEDRPVLCVRALRVSPLFEQQSFVYRRGDGTYASDFHNQFFVLPAHNITGEVRQWLSDSGLFRSVTTVPGILGERHLLSGSVEQLYGDYRDDGPRAVVTIDFVILGTGDVAELTFSREYTETVTLPGPEPEELVRGWNQALASILGRLEADLRDLDFSPPPEEG
jgi:cholesterol transport system auxiliary component